MSPSRRFGSVVLDVDSTLCGIEGIDWLARRRGNEIAQQVATQTDRAMRGELRLEDVYAERLNLVRPSASDVDDLAAEYQRTLATGASDFIPRWISRGVRVVLVSGGIRQAILPLAGKLRIPPERVHAVTLEFTPAGDYAGFDTTSPLSVATGKRDIVATLNLPRPILAIGDGATDLAMREVTDAFAAFTGFAKRAAVIEKSDFTAATFEELDTLIRG